MRRDVEGEDAMKVIKFPVRNTTALLRGFGVREDTRDRKGRTAQDLAVERKQKLFPKLHAHFSVGGSNSTMNGVWSAPGGRATRAVPTAGGERRFGGPWGLGGGKTLGGGSLVPSLGPVEATTAASGRPAGSSLGSIEATTAASGRPAGSSLGPIEATTAGSGVGASWKLGESALWKGGYRPLPNGSFQWSLGLGVNEDATK